MKYQLVWQTTGNRKVVKFSRLWLYGHFVWAISPIYGACFTCMLAVCRVKKLACGLSIMRREYTGIEMVKSSPIYCDLPEVTYSVCVGEKAAG